MLTSFFFFLFICLFQEIVLFNERLKIVRGVCGFFLLLFFYFKTERLPVWMNHVGVTLST